MNLRPPPTPSSPPPPALASTTYPPPPLRLLQFATGSSQPPALGFGLLTSNDGSPRRFTIESIAYSTTHYGASDRSGPFIRAHSKWLLHPNQILTMTLTLTLTQSSPSSFILLSVTLHPPPFTLYPSPFTLACFNKLDLPEYLDEGQLRAAVATILALDSTGFTMD